MDKHMDSIGMNTHLKIKNHRRYYFPRLSRTANFMNPIFILIATIFTGMEFL